MSSSEIFSTFKPNHLLLTFANRRAGGPRRVAQGIHAANDDAVVAVVVRA
jgi:hypothetical protein